MTCTPAANWTSLPSPMSSGTRICTPPSASVSVVKDVKSVSMKWSIRTPVSCSTVSIMSDGPP